MSSAMPLVPTSTRASTQPAAGSTMPAEPSELSPVLSRMSTSGTARTAMTVPAFGGLVAWTSSFSLPNSESTGSGMRLLTAFAHR